MAWETPQHLAIFMPGFSFLSPHGAVWRCKPCPMTYYAKSKRLRLSNRIKGSRWIAGAFLLNSLREQNFRLCWCGLEVCIHIVNGLGCLFISYWTVENQNTHLARIIFWAVQITVDVKISKTEPSKTFLEYPDFFCAEINGADAKTLIYLLRQKFVQTIRT